MVISGGWAGTLCASAAVVGSGLTAVWASLRELAEFAREASAVCEVARRSETCPVCDRCDPDTSAIAVGCLAVCSLILGLGLVVGGRRPAVEAVSHVQELPSLPAPVLTFAHASEDFFNESSQFLDLDQVPARRHRSQRV